MALLQSVNTEAGRIWVHGEKAHRLNLGFRRVGRLGLRRRSAAHHARGLSSTPATRPTRFTASTGSCSSRCPGPATPAVRWTTSNLGKYFFEVVDRASNRVLYSRGLRLDLRRVGDDRRGERRCGARSRSRSGFRRPRSPSRSSSRSAIRRTRSARSGASSSIRRTRPSTFEARLARSAPRDPEVGRSGRQGRLPDPRRRVHGGRARQVREGRAPSRRHPLRASRRSRSAARTSTSGPSVRRRKNPGSPARRPASTAARASERPTTRSAASATS